MPQHNSKQQPVAPERNQSGSQRLNLRRLWNRVGKIVSFCLLIFGIRISSRRWLARSIYGLLLLLLICFGAMYGIAEWYIHSESSKQLQMGVSFIPDYAQSLGVDPQSTMDALLHIGVKQFRLVSYWNDLEPTPGHYDFSSLDWQFQKAEASHAQVILTVGLRQPRWPECHMPTWAENEPKQVWEPQLLGFMKAVVQRYRNSPSLMSYQLENEYFLKGFGACTDFSRSRLISEYNLLRQTDPNHPILIGRSNNALGIPIGQPIPTEYSISVYKRVWDGGFSHRYFEYPFPAWYYGFLAGSQQLVLHKDMIIGELQAEAWPPEGKIIPQITLSEQNKSFNASRFEARISYGKATGMRQIELWGAEYWYYRLVILHDPSLWRVAQQEFSQKNAE